MELDTWHALGVPLTLRSNPYVKLTAALSVTAPAMAWSNMSPTAAMPGVCDASAKSAMVVPDQEGERPTAKGVNGKEPNDADQVAAPDKEIEVSSST